LHIASEIVPVQVIGAAVTGLIIAKPAMTNEAMNNFTVSFIDSSNKSARTTGL